MSDLISKIKGMDTGLQAKLALAQVTEWITEAKTLAQTSAE